MVFLELLNISSPNSNPLLSFLYYNERNMYTVKGKIEVLNTNVVNVLQSCLYKVFPACEMRSAGNWRSLRHQFASTSPKLLSPLRAASVKHILNMNMGRSDWWKSGDLSRRNLVQKFIFKLGTQLSTNQ